MISNLPPIWVFSANFTKIFGTFFFKNTPGWMLLYCGMLQSRDTFNGNRPGCPWLARPQTRHVKNTHAVYHTPKILYGVLLYLLMLHSYSTLFFTIFSITFVKFSVSLFSTLCFVPLVFTFGFFCTCYLLSTLKQN